MLRLLFVHAHPDDETLTCGTTMAHHVAAGDEVHVLTCTLGEEGEVVPAELAPLEGAAGDPLGAWRREELREAMRRLGASHAVLGEGAGASSRYRDSGMEGMPSAHHPRAFVRADLVEAAGLVAGHLRAVRPDVVVTYDPHGGYGHPDHVQTHRVTTAALTRLDASERPARAFQILTPRSWAVEDRSWLGDHAPRDVGWRVPADDDPYPPSVVDDDLVSHVVVDEGQVRAQAHALAAHRTQVTVRGDVYALSNDLAVRLSGREAYVRVDPRSGTPLPRPAARHTGGVPGWEQGLVGDTGA